MLRRRGALLAGRVRRPSGSSGTQALETIPGYYGVFGRAWYLGIKVGL